ncbi:MAG: D-alanyl-D-alanine carboxypeptidase [Lachnospiraceae bacterium]|nr:D-alanyl-D-alanine carboxypeptidase [Lachnospiraceae bacterium]
MYLKQFFQKCHKGLTKLLLSSVLCSTITFSSITAYADVDYEAEMENRKSLPIQSNEIAGWPEGPAIGAESAILMEMNTHTVLYAKNIDEKMFPASTTKILTCLLAAQNCDLNDKVTFSKAAVYEVPRDGSNMGIDEGEVITLEQAMYGVLVGSANEAASAVGEHVAACLGKEPTAKAFASIMNEKAKELGCKNTHFVNANGLYDENHYTTAFDLALIGCEFFNNEILCKMSSTPNYNIPPTTTQPDDIWVNSKNKLLKTRELAYPYLLGSKTGFVSQSRQTLVSGAEKDGMKLVCVVFKEETPYQFEDTVKLFQYGFENFKKLMVDDYETKYSMDNMDLFDTGSDLFGDSTPLMSMESDSYIIVPSTAEFEDTVSKVTYSKEVDSNVIATIEYSYSNVPIGNCDIMFSSSLPEQFAFSSQDETPAEFSSEAANSSIEEETSEGQNVIFINVKKVIMGILIVAGIIILIMIFLSVLSSYNFSPRGQSSKRRKQRIRDNRIAKKNAKQAAKRQRQQMKRNKKAYKKRKHSRFHRTYD